MTKKSKWVTLALLAGGAVVFEGCLGAFWNGLWNTGWPAGNKWLNLAIDIVNESVLG